MKRYSKITFQSFTVTNRTVDGSFISRSGSLLTRELKRASKEYPAVGKRARPYIYNYSFCSCCRKAWCRLSLSVLYLRIIHGSKIPNNSVPSRVHVHVSFGVFSFQLSHFDFFIVQETLTTLGIYISLFSAPSSAGMKT